MEEITQEIEVDINSLKSSAKWLIDNLQREDLTPIDESECFQRLLDLKDSHWNQERIAEVIGKSPTYISQSLRFLGFPHDVLEKFWAQNFSRSHALYSTEIVNKKLFCIGS